MRAPFFLCDYLKSCINGQKVLKLPCINGQKVLKLPCINGQILAYPIFRGKEVSYEKKN